MKRRDFLTTTAATGALALGSSALAQGASPDEQRSFFEWRTYRLAGADRQAKVGEYLEHAAIPAWRRMGLGPVGAFTEIGPNGSPSLHVLLEYPTAEKFAAARTVLEADADYQKAAADYLASPKEAPAFTRIDSWFLLAFPSAPQLTPPKEKPTVYEMRTYESYSEERARKKIEMFGAGEIPVFVDSGFQPIFFGETLVGTGLPCLKYMLAAPDMAANEAGWKKFQSHPDWLKLRDQPQYANTVSNIQKLFLTPTAYSQV